tara:strand:- start:148 stop:624 length:477 start_codon:yes stop_codon:yes gene_type:complete
MAKRKRTLKTLKRLTDEQFSKYIRYKGADADGYSTCITCNKALHVTKLQCGHFVSRRYAVTRYEPDNVASQCVACNIFNQGEQWLFGQAIDRKKPGRAAELMQRAHRGGALSYADIEQLYQRYKVLAAIEASTRNVEGNSQAMEENKGAEKAKDAAAK